MASKRPLLTDDRKHPIESIYLSVHEIRIIIDALDYFSNDRLIYDPDHPFKYIEAQRILDKLVDLRDRTAAVPLPAFVHGRILKNDNNDNT